MTSQPFGPETMEFHREFAEQTDKLLRRRLLWFISIWGGLGILGTIPIYLGIIDHHLPVGFLSEALRGAFYSDDAVHNAIVNSTWIAVYAAALVLTINGNLNRTHALWLSLALITIDGLYGITLRAAGLGFGPGILLFTLSHFIAALVFPWSARQAVVPAAIVLAINALSRLTIEIEPNSAGQTNYSGPLLAVLLSPLLVVPGCLVAWGRHTRRLGQHRFSFVQKRYGSLRQELSYARAIHESMFPNPITTGTVCFTYKYEPMRQIGGDYLFASSCPTEDGKDKRLSVVLLDVTGHGIPAALTVNRLHGEIELLFADNPAVSPGEVLGRLNRYVHLTLARHSIYVTAICLRIDPQHGVVEFASGGHPPAFLRAVDGTVNNLDSTAFVLGACAGKDFDPGQASIPFGPGDSLIAYTDGATEARTETGQMLRIEGMRKLLATPKRVEPGHWPEKLLDAVTRHRDGRNPEDDTLVVELFRSLDKPCDPPTKAEAIREPAL